MDNARKEAEQLLNDGFRDEILPGMIRDQLKNAREQAEEQLREPRRATGQSSYTPRRYTEQVGNLLTPERHTFEPDNDLVYTPGQKAKRATEEQDPPTKKENVLYRLAYPIRKLGQAVGRDSYIRQQRDEFNSAGAPWLAATMGFLLPSTTKGWLDDTVGLADVRPGRTQILGDNFGGIMMGVIVDITGGFTTWGISVAVLKAGILVALGLNSLPGLLVGLAGFGVILGAKVGVNLAESVITDIGTVLSRGVKKLFNIKEDPYRDYDYL